MVGVGVFSGVRVAEGDGEGVNVGEAVGDGGMDVDVTAAEDVAWVVGVGSVGEGEKLGFVDAQPVMANIRKITWHNFFMSCPVIVLGWTRLIIQPL